MSSDFTSQDPNRETAPTGAPANSRSPLLERITAAALLSVVVALAWIITAAFAPGLASFLPVEGEVIVILLLLIAALVLVSVVSLLHTR